MEKNDIEIWQPVPGYEGKYEASSLGRIKSLNYLRTGKVKELSPGLTGKGYLSVVLTKDGKQKMFPVHGLIYAAFKGPIPPGMTIDHIDNVKTNNRPENLQLLTREENTRKARKGKPLSAEHRSKLSVAAKARYQRAE